MTNKIGWQPYEEMLKEQLSSPFSALIMSNSLQTIQSEVEAEEELEIYEFDSIENQEKEMLIVPVPDSFQEQINLLTNYECWIGHTNFDIRESTKLCIEQIEGVEILKICSRYRFFIGVGKMFNFSDTRRLIEETVL